MNTPVVARIGLDRIGLPADLISPEQAVDEALTALQAHQATTITRAEMTAAFDGMKAAVVQMIKARLAASQPGTRRSALAAARHRTPNRNPAARQTRKEI